MWYLALNLTSSSYPNVSGDTRGAWTPVCPSSPGERERDACPRRAGWVLCKGCQSYCLCLFLGGQSSKKCDEGLGVCSFTYLLCFSLLGQLPEDLLPALVPVQLSLLVLSKFGSNSVSSGSQLIPGFPCCAAPAALPVKPAAGDKACGLGKAFPAARGRHLLWVLICFCHWFPLQSSPSHLST